MNRWIKGAAPVLSTLLLAAFLWTGCDILDVENPNNLIEDDLNNPAAAGPMANGAEAAVARALSFVYAPYSVATDEMTWVGSRDAWGQLDNGVIDFPGNEFSDQAYPYVGEARWMTDEFAKRLEAFREQGAGNTQAQIRVYLYKAIIYTTIADMFDDFTISDRTEPGPPVGPQNMGTLYDEALSAVNKALALGPTGELEAALLGMKARIVHGKAVWQKVNPVDTANPLVSAGAAEAAAALAKMDPNFRYQMVFDGGFQLANYMASEVNNRLEFTFTDTWVRRNAAGNKVEEVTYPDMIDGVVHPYLQEVIETYVAEREYSDITVVSAREMHLILAEAALAGGDMNGFTTHINNLRALDGLSPYSGQVDARQLLIESRAVNLFLQGRRLADLYRFGLRSPEWVDTAPAVTRPGTFLPITKIEIEANPLVQ